MATGPALLLVALALTVVVGPSALGLAGARSARHAKAGPPSAGRWRLVAASALLYVLAFNLTFFLQELALVLPKALTPGLHPVLYHNNHRWEGTNPLAGLFQGTGALATLAVGLVCLWRLRRPRRRASGTRLFLFWMAYCGCFMALPQVVIGALSAGSDVGMAMAYLQLGEAARIGAGLVALGLMPLVALSLCRPALELVDGPARTAGAGSRLVFWAVTLPAMLGTVLVVPFRVPRELLEVVLVPLLVILPGIPWIQAGAWRVRGVSVDGVAPGPSVVYPLTAVVALLLVFQLVLRPGIAF
jgi:hypothetical protein